MRHCLDKFYTRQMWKKRRRKFCPFSTPSAPLILISQMISVMDTHTHNDFYIWFSFHSTCTKFSYFFMSDNIVFFFLLLNEPITEPILYFVFFFSSLPTQLSFLEMTQPFLHFIIRSIEMNSTMVCSRAAQQSMPGCVLPYHQITLTQNVYAIIATKCLIESISITISFFFPSSILHTGPLINFPLLLFFFFLFFCIKCLFEGISIV